MNSPSPAWHKQLERLGIPLSAGQVAALERYAARIREWSPRAGLVAPGELAALEERHLVDSLAVLGAVADLFAGAPRTVDIGSGAGLPGLALAIVRPDLPFVLLEATEKKAAFLRAVVGELGLAAVQVVAARAETLGQDAAYRARFGLALARAVARLPALIELALPFLQLGGRLVAWKGPEAGSEVAAAAPALRRLGGHLTAIRPAKLEGRLAGHCFVVIEKVAPTPPAYPRRPGLPVKRPL